MVCKTVTIVAVTCRRIEEHVAAINATANCLPFRALKLLIAPYKIGNDLSWAQVPELMPDGRWEIEDFNKFMVSRLADYITTDYALTVHWDGFAVNRSKWSDEFLQYDYIGAPWPWWVNLKSVARFGGLKQRVGNGGFSLRSRKWMILSKAMAGAHAGESEDAWCCKTMAREFFSSGCRVAPTEVAQQFSYEHNTRGCRSPHNSFGFHGRRAMEKLFGKGRA